MDSDVKAALDELNGHMRVSAVADKLRDYPPRLAYEVEGVLRISDRATRDAEMLKLTGMLPDDWMELVLEDFTHPHVEEWSQFKKAFNRPPLRTPLTGEEKAELDTFTANLRRDRINVIEARFADRKSKAKSKADSLRIEAEMMEAVEGFRFSERDVALISGKEAELQMAASKRQMLEDHPLLKSRDGGLSPRGIRSKRKNYA